MGGKDLSDEPQGTVRRLAKPLSTSKPYASILKPAKADPISYATTLKNPAKKQDEPRRSFTALGRVSQDSCKSNRRVRNVSSATAARRVSSASKRSLGPNKTPPTTKGSTVATPREPLQGLSQVDGADEVGTPASRSLPGSIRGGDAALAEPCNNDSNSEVDIPRYSLATTRGSIATTRPSHDSYMPKCPRNSLDPSNPVLGQAGQSAQQQLADDAATKQEGLKPLHSWTKLKSKVFENAEATNYGDENSTEVGKAAVNHSTKKRPALHEAINRLKKSIQESRNKLRVTERHHLGRTPVPPTTNVSQRSGARTVSGNRAVTPSSYKAVESIINDYAEESSSSSARVSLDIKIPGEKQSLDSLNAPPRPSWADDTTAAILRSSLDVPRKAPIDEPDVIEDIANKFLPSPKSSKFRLVSFGSQDFARKEPRKTSASAGIKLPRIRKTSSEYSLTGDKPFGDIPDKKRLLCEDEDTRIFSSASENAGGYASMKSMASGHRSTRRRLQDLFNGIRHVSWSEARGRKHLKRSPLPTSMIEG